MQVVVGTEDGDDSIVNVDRRRKTMNAGKRKGFGLTKHGADLLDGVGVDLLAGVGTPGRKVG